MDDRIFTLDEARALLPAVMEEAAVVIAARADLAEIDFARRTGGGSELGGLPELKGLQARIEEILSGWNERGIEVKGIAPVLVDFPSVLDGFSVRLCWIEGERELGWYHRTELGFAGRRPL
ncbi:hypothetical protein B0I32_124105 [Nonomuraea fuscirosea]|jgi:hypothetical protein|uniref:DUF2203 family protein n=1 Tax=Nonomuraea fuscirosea TaxID=1291556 RepID=A0A2T0MKF8_9ACTN|nr:DUF2203 domain-containing protein [Nonomuraea fuscirosea]PRX58117.1 hypothetical protein B0I32_124105 [Nonomuraea fuscirosea]WSA55065.1 DUF2203 domain-containing protein [Nonomuraea fuscirosea]